MPTHYHGTPPEEQALSAFINFVRAADSLTARIHQYLGSYGLTETQFAVLEVLLQRA